MKFKFNLEGTVQHKTLFGEFFIVARGCFQSKTASGKTIDEIVYRCRMGDGRIAEFFENELLPLNKKYHIRILKAKGKTNG